MLLFIFFSVAFSRRYHPPPREAAAMCTATFLEGLVGGWGIVSGAGVRKLAFHQESSRLDGVLTPAPAPTNLSISTVLPTSLVYITVLFFFCGFS